MNKGLEENLVAEMKDMVKENEKLKEEVLELTRRCRWIEYLSRGMVARDLVKVLLDRKEV